MLARQPLKANRARTTTAKSGIVTAAVGGWDASSALADMPADRAVQLDDWFPQPGYVEVRRGYDYHSWDLKTDSTPVQSLMVWQGQASSKKFAAASDTIYETTAEGAGVSSLTGLSGARWQWVNFTNSGATYLYCVNGADSARHYNGSAWATPSITGVASSDFVHVNVHKKRLWFTQVNSTRAWYLATDAIAGAATSFELGSVFTRGGYLMAMASWTRDGGSGSDDYAVFISSRGQIAVYSGTDPANANTWALVGVFDAPAPLGRRCFTRFGADVLLITVEGVYPLSQVLSVDQSQARGLAITRNIQNAMVEAARLYKDNFGWELCVYSKGTRLILNVPTSENARAVQYVMNTLTGAWCRFTNHNANCWVVYNDRLFFAGNEGDVYEADKGGADIATPITAIGQSAYQALRQPILKRVTMLQPLLTISGLNRPALGISTDFQETAELSTANVEQGAGTSTWDSFVWDTDTWAGSISTINDWVSVPAIGTFFSIKFQARTGVDTRSPPSSFWGISLWGDSWGGTSFAAEETMRINGFRVLYEPGGYL